MSSENISIREWRADKPAEEIDMLAEVLHAAVHAGASVGFVLPFSMDDARAFWRDKILPGVTVGSRRVLLALEGNRIVGTVQLGLDVMPNQRHRADVAKLLVHPDLRRRGIARALMTEIEKIALTEKRMLLTLDTRTGDHAEPLYSSMGYVTVGVIPGYAKEPSGPKLDGTTIMYKHL